MVIPYGLSRLTCSDVLQAVVLFAMGGYGSYLGFRIRLSKDPVSICSSANLRCKMSIESLMSFAFSIFMLVYFCIGFLGFEFFNILKQRFLFKFCVSGNSL